MKAMLLAAGLGTRLKPITDTIPKPLVLVGGLPLIFYNLALLKKQGITDVVINLHHLGGQIKKLLGNGEEYGFRFRYSTEPEILGTAGGIKRAERFFKKESFLVLNGDIINDVNLKKLIAQHNKEKPLATLVVIKSPLAKQYGTLYTRGRKLVSILTKPASTQGLTSTFFTGIHILSPSFFKKIPLKKSCIIRDVYIPEIKNGGTLRAYQYKGLWNDLGTIERLRLTSHLLAKGKMKLSYQKELNHFQKILQNKKAYHALKHVDF